MLATTAILRIDARLRGGQQPISLIPAGSSCSPLIQVAALTDLHFRWGTSSEAINQQYRRRRARGEWISFHGGKRTCLGEKFAMLEMRTTLVQLVRDFSFSLDPMWIDRKTPVSILAILMPAGPD